MGHASLSCLAQNFPVNRWTSSSNEWNHSLLTTPGAKDSTTALPGTTFSPLTNGCFSPKLCLSWHCLQSSSLQSKKCTCCTVLSFQGSRHRPQDSKHTFHRGLVTQLVRSGSLSLRCHLPPVLVKFQWLASNCTNRNSEC